MLSCFAGERKHKSYKRFAAACTHFDGFEKTLSLQLINDQIRELHDGFALKHCTMLIRPSSCPLSLEGIVQACFNDVAPGKVWFSTSVRHEFKTFGNGDKAFRKSGVVGEIRACLQYYDEFL